MRSTIKFLIDDNMTLPYSTIKTTDYYSHKTSLLLGLVWLLPTSVLLHTDFGIIQNTNTNRVLVENNPRQVQVQQQNASKSICRFTSEEEADQYFKKLIDSEIFHRC